MFDLLLYVEALSFVAKILEKKRARKTRES
ncbi:MAG: hypothetical protein QOE33_1883, partial [Acidobacteriota bacterium]|nr:hypothetical protein [Acidobacteriota bacterium]